MTRQTLPQNMPAVPADWSMEWNRVSAGSSTRRQRNNGPSFWEKRARRFSAMDNGAAGRVQQMVERFTIDKNTTILDIGCGPGNLAVPLAKIAGSVTALDPAPAMLRQLEAFASKEGVVNISTICRSWDNVAPGKEIAVHDIVLSSYSMIMQDAGQALAAMDASARRTVCLFWFAGRQTFGYDDFWSRLFNEPYVAGPDHVMLLNILNAMAIYPDVAIIPQRHIIRYQDLDDAVSCWAENLHVSSPGEKDTIRALLKERLVPEGNQLVYSRSVRTAMIWWHKNGDGLDMPE